jgi:response regulator RpfG family c-di-GMP phosphodiesterase
MMGQSPMTSSKEKAAEFRRQAALCREVAERMSLEEDRVRMIKMAEHWLELAKRAETETDESSAN